MTTPVDIDVSAWYRQASTPILDGNSPLSLRGGGVLTINDSGFGTKDSTTPYYEDFESESLGASGSSIGDLVLTTTGGTNIVDTDKNSGSQCVSHLFTTVDFPKLYYPLSGVKRRGYFSCSLKFSGTSGGSGAVWKLARVGANTVYSGVSKAGWSYVGNSADVPTANGSELVSSNGIQAAGQVENGNISGNYAPYSDIFSSEVWQFYEVEWDFGTADGDDSYFTDRVNNNPTVTWNGEECLTAANSDLPDWILTPINGFGTTGHPVTYYMDDVYVDETRNRVVMTDNATYASSTKWAVQPVLTWSDTQITCTGKRQGFAVDDTAYLHVFNNSGALVHSTSSITVGADA